MIKKDTLVTIAIPFYNSEKFLSYAIQSVINQTYENWELLLMDDHGKDNSMEIAREFSSQDSRIKIISDGKNRGLPYRLNESISLAKGEIYVRMDDDDIMTSDRIETQVEYLLTHPGVNVVGSSAMIIDDKNRIISSASMEGVTDRFMHPTVCAWTEWYYQHPYNEQFRRCQDIELWLRTERMSYFYNIERPLLFYRELGVPTFKKYLQSQNMLFKMYKEYQNYDKTYFWFLENTIKTCCKVSVYALFVMIGKLDYLIGKRNRRSLPENLWLSEKDLENAVKVKL